MNTVSLSYNKDVISSKHVTAVIGVTFFVLATSLGAYVRIPVPGSPVPITLQTFFVLLSGAVLGRRLGSVSQLGYILLGAIGLPVFQGAGVGMSYLAGPTGGYIVGFMVAAWTVGSLARSENISMARLIAVFTAGSLIIYAFGTAWLVYLYRIDIAHALSVGVLPFIPADVAKVSLAALLFSKIASRSKALFSA